jgi:hypothetical protein
MRRYRTEIRIPADRAVLLHLPPDLPEGRAIVTVVVADEEEPGAEVAAPPEADLEGQDIEWWEEFDGEEWADEAPVLRVPSGPSRA